MVKKLKAMERRTYASHDEKNEQQINGDHGKNNKKITFLCKKKKKESLRARAMHQRNLSQEEDGRLPQ